MVKEDSKGGLELAQSKVLALTLTLPSQARVSGGSAGQPATLGRSEQEARTTPRLCFAKLDEGGHHLWSPVQLGGQRKHFNRAYHATFLYLQVGVRASRPGVSYCRTTFLPY